MKYTTLILSFLTLGFFSTISVFAGVETDKYCHEGSLGFSWWDWVTPLFSVNYNGTKKPIYTAMQIGQWQYWVSEGTGMLYYWINAGSGFKVYQYNCVTSKPKYIGTTTYDSSYDISSSSWYATYNEPYILFATMYSPWPGATGITNLYVYNVNSQKIELTIPHLKYNPGFYNSWPEIVYKTKTGKFIITFVGDHWKLVRKTVLIQIDPKTLKITEL